MLKSWFKNKGEAKFRFKLQTKIAESQIQVGLCLISDSDGEDSEMATF